MRVKPVNVLNDIQFILEVVKQVLVKHDAHQNNPILQFK